MLRSIRREYSTTVQVSAYPAAAGNDGEFLEIPGEVSAISRILQPLTDNYTTLRILLP